MSRFVCPECKREVVADAGLEGKAADCARCGAHIESWLAPSPKTRTPKGRLTFGNLFHFAMLCVFVVLVLMVLVAVFGRR